MTSPSEKAKEIIAAVKTIDAQLAALNITRSNLRGQLVEELGFGGAEKMAADIDGYRATWHPEKKASKEDGKLDRGLLVRAGVTPEQLDAGTKPGGAKKAYLDIRQLAAVETPDAA